MFLFQTTVYHWQSYLLREIVWPKQTSLSSLSPADVKLHQGLVSFKQEKGAVLFGSLIFLK